MNTEPLNSSGTPVTVSDIQPTAPDGPVVNNSNIEPSRPSLSGVSLWAKKFQIPQSVSSVPDESNFPKSALARLTSGIGLRLSPKDQNTQQNSDGSSSQSNFIGNLTKGIVDSSKTAVKAVTVRARHVVSQNKRRYQEDGFDLDLTYITENIIAMGFPAGDMSSGFLGYVEGIYRNHMEEVIRFLETHHKGKYKVYNLCSERLYDVSLFEGKVASFPFGDHNCPPIQLITSFCRSAYSWLKDDIENVVAVHCKAGMARTGLMISSLILYLKFFPTAEESIDFYNQKRCFDGKALVLPSQIRYVKYFERGLTYFSGDNQPGRRCMLRGFRLHRCPYWIRPHITISNHNGVLFSTKKHPRTKDLSPEEFWFSPPKKGITVFALPGERGITELAGDFRVYFHDRQGDFYFWLNTTMTENRKTLSVSDIDWFDKRKLPSPGFQVEVVLVDYDGSSPPSSPAPQPSLEYPSPQQTSETHNANPSVIDEESSPSISNKSSKNQDKSDVFSDSEGEEDAMGSAKGRNTEVSASTRDSRAAGEPVSKDTSLGQMGSLTQNPERISNGKESLSTTSSATESKDNVASGGGSEFKVVAADASVFTFGDEEDFESD